MGDYVSVTGGRTKKDSLDNDYSRWPQFSDASINELACSFLHRIAMRLKIIPYTNMVKWIIDDADISDREFKTRGQEVIGSFTPDNLRLMYHLPKPQVTYNKQFVEKLVKENEDLTNCTKNWSYN